MGFGGGGGAGAAGGSGGGGGGAGGLGALNTHIRNLPIVVRCTQPRWIVQLYT